MPKQDPSDSGVGASARDDLLQVIERLDRALADEAALPARAAPPAAPETALSPDLRERWRRLCETSALLNATDQDAESVLETVLGIALELTRARRGLLFLKQDDGSLEVLVSRDAEGRSLPASPRDYARTVVDRVAESGEPSFGKTTGGAGSSVLCVPLATFARPPREAPAKGAPEPPRSERRRFPGHPRDRVVGVIYLDTDGGPGKFREEDLYLALTLANHATTAIQGDRLHRAAITDPLTRLFTRRQLERQLEDAFSRFEGARAPFAFLLVDVDHMRRVNERHGQIAGDSVLRDVAASVRGAVRQGDLCFRYGGEELAVFLSDTDEKGALVVAEKVRAKVAETPCAGGQVRVTVSVGASSCPAQAASAIELVRKADQALYRAKALGRNRSEAWSPELGAAAPRTDRLAGIITGSFAVDYNHVALLLDTFAQLPARAELREVCVLAVDKAIEATAAERGALMLADDAGLLSTVVARGRDRRALELRERFSRSVPERVLRSGEPLHVVASDDGASLADSIADLGLTTILCAPLVAADASDEAPARIGVLYVDARKGTGELREAALPFFSALARHLALAIENARLRARLRLGVASPPEG